MSDKKTRNLNDEFNDEVFERAVAEKGNTTPTLKPKEYLILFEPELAPTGHIGVQRDLPSNPEHLAEEPEIDVYADDISVEEIEHGYIIQTRIDDEPSKNGLEGGRISRLTLIEGDRSPENVKVHFENGEWKKPPSTFLEKQIAMEKRDQHNGTSHETERRDKGQSPDNDIDL